MTLYELTKKYGTGKGEDTMWKALAAVSDSIESSMDEKDRRCLLKKVYAAMSGCHYDRDFAKEDVAKMYYTDGSGVSRFAPYWTEEQIQNVYARNKSKIPSYNVWDFCVTMNMVASDNWRMLHEWFPGMDMDAFTSRVAEMAVNWLNDPDSPYGTSKVWDYMNPSR